MTITYTAGGGGTTPPSVSDGEVTAGTLTVSSATLTATVDAGTAATTVGFKYGTTLGGPYNLTGTVLESGTENNSVAANATGVSKSVNLTGLTPGTTYYYKWTASGASDVETDEGSFTTACFDGPSVTARGGALGATFQIGTVSGASSYLLSVWTGAGGYARVTTAPTSWAGEYVIVGNNDDTYAMNNTVSTFAGRTAVTVVNNTITTTDDTIIWTVAGNDTDGYTIKNGSYYLNPATAKSVGWSTTANGSWDFAVDEDGVATIMNHASTGWRLEYNSGSSRFCCYNNTLPDLRLFKKNGTPATGTVNGGSVVTLTDVSVSGGTTVTVGSLAANTSPGYSWKVKVTGGGCTAETTGTGLSVSAGTPAISVNPASLAVGTVTVGSSGTGTVRVSNTGTASLSITGITFEGTDPTRFSASPTTATIAAGSYQDITVTYTPGVAGSHSATMKIAHNDTATGSPTSVDLTGTGLAGEYTWSGTGSGWYLRGNSGGLDWSTGKQMVTDANFGSGNYSRVTLNAANGTVQYKWFGDSSYWIGYYDGCANPAKNTVYAPGGGSWQGNNFSSSFFTSGKYYTFRGKFYVNPAEGKENERMNDFVIMETTGAPTEFVSAGAGNPSGTLGVGAQTVSVTLNQTPNSEETVYVRYKAGSAAWATAELDSGSGTSWSGTIPTQPVGTTVEYYFLTTTVPKATLDAIPDGVHANADLCTLNGLKNGANNWTYTVAAASVTASAVSGSALTATYPNASSGYQSFTVSGVRLTGALTVTAPSGFAICSTSGGTYGNELTLTPSGTTLGSTTVYVKLAANTMPGSKSGNVTISGGGLASDVTVAVSGTVNKGTPVITDSGAGTPGTASATVGAKINAKGADTTVTFEWGMSEGTYDHTETVTGGDVSGHANQVSASQTARAVSASISGLTGGTTYYYRWTASNGNSATPRTGSFETACISGPLSVTADGDALSATFTIGTVSGAAQYLLSVWSGSIGYTQVTEAPASSWAGTYVIVAASADNAMNNTCSASSSGYMGITAVTISSGSIATPAAALLWTLAGNDTDGYTLYNEAAEKYLQPATGTSMTWSSSAGDGRWLVSIDGDNVVKLLNKATVNEVEQYYLEYNSSANPKRFTCYKGTQGDLRFFKKNESFATGTIGGWTGELNEKAVTAGEVLVTGLAANEDPGYNWSVKVTAGNCTPLTASGTGLEVTAALVAPVWTTSTVGPWDTTLAAGVSESDMRTYLTTVGNPAPGFSVTSVGANTPSGSYGMSGNAFSFTPALADAGKAFTFRFTASNSQGTPTKDVTVNVAAGSLTLTGSFSKFEAAAGAASMPQSVTLTGSNLGNGETVTVAVGAPFEVSLTGNDNDYGASKTVAASAAGAISSQTVYVRVASTASQGNNQTGTLTASCTSASSSATKSLTADVSGESTATAIERSYIVVNDGSGTTWYNGSGTGQTAGNFSEKYLGEKTSVRLAAEASTRGDGSAAGHVVTMNYTVDTGTEGAWSTLTMPWKEWDDPLNKHQSHDGAGNLTYTPDVASGLAPGLYYIRVFFSQVTTGGTIYDSRNNLNYVASFRVVPTAPTLAVGTVAGGTVSGTITRGTGGSSVVVYRYDTSAKATAASGGNFGDGVACSVGVGGTTFSDSGLTGCSQYYYRAWEVATGNPDGSSSYSAGSNVLGPVETTAPGTPVVSVTDRQNTSITLSWPDVAGATGYLLSMWTQTTGPVDKTARYTIASTSSVTASGDEPGTVTAAFENTYTTKNQITKNNSMTLTLTGYAGKKVKGLKLSMKSNTSTGAGSLSVTSGGNTLLSVADADFDDDSWNGGWSTSYVTLDFSSSLTATTIGAGQTLVIEIDASTSSLYCEWFEVVWEGTQTTTAYVGTYDADGDGATSPVTVSGLAQGTRYDYKVWAVGSGASCKSTPAEGYTTTTGTQAPGAPTVSGSSTAAGSVSVTVTAGSPAPAGTEYVVYRFTDGDVAAGVATPTAAASAGGVLVGDGVAAGTFTDSSGVQGCTTYYYVGWADNSGVLSSASAVGSATTPSPGAPQSLAEGTVTAHAAELEWSAPASGGAAGYAVDVWHVAGGTKTASFTVDWATDDEEDFTTVVTATGVVPDGAGATFTTDNRVDGVSAGHTVTLRLTGYAGYRITGVTLHASSEEDEDTGTESGAGSFTMTVGSTTVASIPSSSFSSANWNGAFSYAWVDISPEVTATTVGSGQTVTLTLTGTEDTIYCDRWTITYEGTGRVYDVDDNVGTGGVGCTVSGTGATLTGLAEGTTYGWSVQALGAGSCGGGTTTDSDGFTTPEMVGAPVIGELTAGVGSLSGRVTGTAGATLILKRYEEEAAALAATATSAMGGVPVSATETGVGTGVWDFSETGLDGCKTYYYRAWQRMEISGETYTSSGSTVVGAQTVLGTPRVTAVGAGTTILLSWDEVKGATSYDVLVSSDSSFTQGAATTRLSEDFDTASPSGWTFSGTGTYGSTGANNSGSIYGNSGYSIKFDDQGDCATTPTFASGATLLSFWSWGYSSGSKFVVEALESGSWQTVEAVAISSGKNGYSVDLSSHTSATQLRFTLNPDSGNCSLDHVTVTGPGAGGTIVYSATVTAAPFTATVPGLTQGNTYYYRVTAHGGETCDDKTASGSASPANGALIKVTPKHYDFGTVDKGETKTVTVTVKNDGNQALSFTGTGRGIELDPTGTPYSLSTADAAGLTGNIPAGGDRTYTVTFAPQSSGTHSVTLRFRSDGLNGDEVEGVVVPGLREVTLTGVCFDPATADPTVYKLEVTDGLGVLDTVWDHSLALESDQPVLAVTAYHYNGIFRTLTGDAKSAKWTLKNPDGSVARDATGAWVQDKPFTAVADATYDGKTCSRFTAPIPALGAGNAVRGTYGLEVTVYAAEGEYSTTTTHFTPIETGWLFDDFTRADVVATGGGVLGYGWTAMTAGSALVGEAAIHADALELYGESGASSAAQGRIAVARNMGDVGYATNPHDFVGTGSWGFHFRTDADTVSWNNGSTAGAFVLGSTEGTWFTSSAGQAGVAVMFTSNTVRLAKFTGSLAGGTLAWMGEGAYSGTKGRTLAVRVDFVPGQDEVEADPDEGIEAHAAVPARFRLYVKAVAETGGDPIKECTAADKVLEIDAPDGLTDAMPYAGMVWNHGQKEAGADTGCRFDDIYMPHMDGQGEPMAFHAIDEDTEAPAFTGFNVGGAVAASAAASAGLPVTGTITDASGIWVTLAGTNNPTWDTVAVPSWELWVNDVKEDEGTISGFGSSVDENGEAVEVPVSFTIPSSAFNSEWRTTNCVVVVKAWDHDIDRAGDSLEGTAEFRFALCAAAPVAPGWATVEGDGAEMAIVRWAHNSTRYIVTRSDTEIGEHATPPQNAESVAVGTSWDGVGTVVYSGWGAQNLIDSGQDWQAYEVVVAPGSTNYFAVYGVSGGDGGTGFFFSDPVLPKAFTWTDEEGTVHWATGSGAANGTPSAGSVTNGAWPLVTPKYEPGEGVDSFAYRTTVPLPNDANPENLALTFGFETRPETGSGWGGPWTGDTGKWKIHDASLLTGSSHYPQAVANKLYWKDASTSSEDEAKLSRPLAAANSGDLFVAAILNFQYGGNNKWVTLGLLDGSGNTLVSFGKQGGDSGNTAAIYTPGTSVFGDHKLTGSGYTLEQGHGHDYVVVGQLSRSEHKLRMWVFAGNQRIPELFTESPATETVTALESVVADWEYSSSLTVPAVAAIQLCAGSTDAANTELGHVYFDEVRFAGSWEELFLFNAPEVFTYDFDKPKLTEASEVSGVQVGTDAEGHRIWKVSDGALAHGDVGLTAQFGLYHRSGIQSASFTIKDDKGTTLLGTPEAGETLVDEPGEGETLDGRVTLTGVSGAAYSDWKTTSSPGVPGGATGVAMPTNWISLDSNYVVEVTLKSTGGKEAVVTAASESGGGGATDLFLGEFGEGSGGGEKYVEIYNGTGHDIDLSQYYIARSNPRGSSVYNKDDSWTNDYYRAKWYKWEKISSTSRTMHHKTTVVLLSNEASSDLLAALRAQCEVIQMTTDVINSGGKSVIALFHAADIENADENGDWANCPTNKPWLDACGLSLADQHFIQSRLEDTKLLPRSAPLVLDPAEWDYRPWRAAGSDTGYTNILATAGVYDRNIGLGGNMEFTVYDDDTEPPALAGGGESGGVRLKGVGGAADSAYIAGVAGERTYVVGGWSFTDMPRKTVDGKQVDKEVSELTLEEYQDIAGMWSGGLTTKGGLSWSPLLGGTDLDGYRNVIEAGQNKGQSGVEFDGISQRKYGCMVAHAATNFAKTDEVWLGFDLEVSQLAEPTLTFGFAGGSAGFSEGWVEWSATGEEGSFTMGSGWDLDPYSGGPSTWSEWSRSLESAGIPSSAGHLWFRVVLKEYGTASGAFRLDNIRLEGNPQTVMVSDQDVADRGLVFEVRMRDESGVDAGAAGVDPESGAQFDSGLPGVSMYRRTPGSVTLTEDGKSVDYTTIQWTAASGAGEKSGGVGKAAAQVWFEDTQAGKGQLRVEVSDLDDDRPGDQSKAESNFGMLMVYDDDVEEPQVRMTTMKPRLDGIVGEWLFKDKVAAAANTMDGVSVGSLGLNTTAGTVSQPRWSLVPKKTGSAVIGDADDPTYAVYQTGWQAGSKFWSATLRTTGGGAGSVTNIHFWSKVGSVDSPTGWELWTKTGDAEAVQVTAGTGSLLDSGTTGWAKEGADASGTTTTLGVWREYNINLSGSPIALPAAGTEVEIRLMGKGAAPKGIGASWFLWDYTMQGELEQATEEGEEGYTYVTDHQLSGSGSGLPMKGSVWDAGSGLAAAPTYSLTWPGGSASGSVTFDTPETALSARRTRGDGAFTTTLPVAMGYTALELTEYKGTITATDADNDRNSSDDGTGENYDSLTHTGKFGFTVVDQDVTRPAAPTGVKVNGAEFRTSGGVLQIKKSAAADWVAFNRETAAWTNKPEFTVSFGVAVDQVPTAENWADSAWTNANTWGEVKKQSSQSGSSGISEYRAALSDTPAGRAAAVPFSVATVEGAFANAGFEETDPAKVGWLLTDGTIQENANAPEGTHCLQVPKGSAGNSSSMPSKPQSQVFVFDNSSEKVPLIGGSFQYYLPASASGSGPEPRIRFDAFTDAAMTNRVWAKWQILRDQDDEVTEAGWRTCTFNYNEAWSNVNSPFAGGPLANSVQGKKINCVVVTLFNTGAGTGCYFDDVRIGIKLGSDDAGTAGSMLYRPSGAAAQGLTGKSVFAMDGDNDRQNDRLEGLAATFYTAYDITPPTAVGISKSAGASTDHVDDPTTQFDVTWSTSGVGPDDTGHANYTALPAELKNGVNSLSPWGTYKFYCGTYEALAVEDEWSGEGGWKDKDQAAWENAGNTGTKPASLEDYLSWKFVESGEYKNWNSVVNGQAIEDPQVQAGGKEAYTGLDVVGSEATKSTRLYDLEFDQNYMIVVVGVDKAGNEGPADGNSWATNNTIKFAITQGVIRAKSVVAASFGQTGEHAVPGFEGNIPGVEDNDKDVAVLEWNVASSETMGVKRKYDLIYWDGEGFNESRTNEWKKIGGDASASVQSNWFADAGGMHRTNEMRFYRAAYENRWRTNVNGQAQTPLMSEDVYAMSKVTLAEADEADDIKVNMVSLHGYPWTNSLRGVFGTDPAVWPAGTSLGTSTRIDVYDGFTVAGVMRSVKTYFFKVENETATEGKWCEQIDGKDVDVTDKPQDDMEFFTKGFGITLPPGSLAGRGTNTVTDSFGHERRSMDWYPILRVPTNGVVSSETTPEGGGSGGAGTSARSVSSGGQFSTWIQCGGNKANTTFNFVSLNLPVWSHPSQMNLLGSGFQQSTKVGLPDDHCDYIYAWDSVKKDIVRPGAMYCDANGTWRLLVGNGPVGGKPFPPNAVVVIVSRSAELDTNGNLTDDGWWWTYDLNNFYTKPTRWGGWNAGGE